MGIRLAYQAIRKQRKDLSMGARGPQAKLGRNKRTSDYERIDFENPTTAEEISALAKLRAMKPSERTKYITALWAEDQVRFLGGVSE